MSPAAAKQNHTSLSKVIYICRVKTIINMTNILDTVDYLGLLKKPMFWSVDLSPFQVRKTNRERDNLYHWPTMFLINLYMMEHVHNFGQV
jgi:hypothetical protein